MPSGVRIGVEIEDFHFFEFLRSIAGQLRGALVENQDQSVGIADENGISGAFEDDTMPLLALSQGFFDFFTIFDFVEKM